ncbi:membrane protein, partial [Cellulomonas bogoriensis 69B4 = DSM 16987]
MTGHRVLRTRHPQTSVRWRPRALALALALVTVAAVLALAGLSTGDLGLTPAQTWAALVTGDGTGGVVVREFRLPRVLAALGAGAALGLSGALFQTLVRNPLGSPELIGFTQGASAGAVAGIVLVGATGWALVGAATAGGAVTALAVYVLAFRRGVLGPRLVLVGIGIGAMLNAVTWWLLTRAELN